uniref:NADH dehydrogenase subunit 6 n=1 Tax=Arytainilla spartiophila TaxID=178948 RepID=A0A344A263_ARYSP|nr:NADH dehydrogenase subunit 6 [Arytainilla spartiophila]AWU48854.1 NADH dehydrogenase subunit 6 [Arytainilla spartiophila]
MIKTMIYFSIFNSSFILVCFHPVSFSIILLLQTISISYLMRSLTQSSWIPFTVFLVMVGGLMILFLYITSICSNKKPNFIYPSISQTSYILITLLFLNNLKNFNSFCENLNNKDLFNMEFIKLFLPTNIFSSNFLFLYLLFMLIIMIEILSASKGPMRKKY